MYGNIRFHSGMQLGGRIRDPNTYATLLFIIHEGGDGPTLVGMGPSLPINTDSSMANAEMVGGAWDSVEGRRHCSKS